MASKTTVVPTEVLESVLYTIPASAAPLRTAANAPRTLPAGTIRDSAAAHRPIRCNHRFAYTPAGTADGSPVAILLIEGLTNAAGLVHGRAPRPGTMTTRWLEATTATVAASMESNRSANCICASSALTNTSTGAPCTIWRASAFDAPKLKRTAMPVLAVNASPHSVSASVRLTAADTSSGALGGTFPSSQKKSHGHIDMQLSMISLDMANSFVRMLSVRDAAERLGVSYPTIKQWIYKGSLRTVRTEGGHHRVPESEVERLLMRRGAPVPAPATRHRVGAVVAISGRNQLRGTIEEVRIDGVLAQVKLRIGNQTLTAIITRDAVDELKLRRGDPAIAIIKATEVMIAREEE